MVLTDHPAWVRTCRECAQFIIGDNGEISEHQELGPGGEVVQVKSQRPPNVPPPCASCPKHGSEYQPGAVPLPAELDYFDHDWFWESRQQFLECRAVNQFAGVDGFQRTVFAEFDQAERRLQGRSADVSANLLARILSLTTQ